MNTLQKIEKIITPISWVWLIGLGSLIILRDGCPPICIPIPWPELPDIWIVGLGFVSVLFGIVGAITKTWLAINQNRINQEVPS